jgi:adenosylhomocysteine nucleosidase
MLVLLGALREEVADLRRQLKLEAIPSQADCRLYRGRHIDQDILLVQSGMGRERAEAAARYVLANYSLSALISFGFAGALVEQLRPGDVVLCTQLHGLNGTAQPEIESDASLLSLMSAQEPAPRWGHCVTVPQPSTTGESKARLGETSQADIVDMESYWIGLIAAEAGVPFLAVRAVTDTRRDCLPPVDRFIAPNGRWQWPRALPHFLSHPRNLIRLWLLYRQAGLARRSLTASLKHLMANMGKAKFER